MSHIDLGFHLHLQLHKVSYKRQEIEEEHNGRQPFTHCTHIMGHITLKKRDKLYCTLFLLIYLRKKVFSNKHMQIAKSSYPLKVKIWTTTITVLLEINFFLQLSQNFMQETSLTSIRNFGIVSCCWNKIVNECWLKNRHQTLTRSHQLTLKTSRSDELRITG